MFKGPQPYKKLISCLGIVGYLEKDIKCKRIRFKKKFTFKMFICLSKKRIIFS